MGRNSDIHSPNEQSSQNEIIESSTNSNDDSDSDSANQRGEVRSKYFGGIAHKRKKANTDEENIDTTDSDDNVPISKKYLKRRPKSEGYSVKSQQVPSKNKCLDCYDRTKNCKWLPGSAQCSNCGRQNRICQQCSESSRMCKPLEYNKDGSLQPKKYASNPRKEQSLQDRCWPCFQNHSMCDGTPPFVTKCSHCKRYKRKCETQELHKLKEENKHKPKCNNCIGNKTACDRKEVCSSCINHNKALCTYKSPTGESSIETIVKVMELTDDPMRNRNNRTIDRYDPEDSRCQRCKSADRPSCDAVPGVNPCYYCFKTPSIKSCAIWTAPAKCERMDPTFWKVEITDDNDFILVRNDKQPPPKIKQIRTKPKKGGSISDTEESTDDVTSSEEEVKGPTGKQKLQAFRHPIAMTTLSTSIDLATAPVPDTYIQAITGSESTEWRTAIQNEYNSLMENGTWEAVDLPHGRKPLTTKWVLKRKLGPDGKISKYKARMVARGFQQKEGFDYTETYSGVVKAASYRTLFALLALNGWHCHQMDVTTAFLNGELEEEVYIHPPIGYPEKKGIALRLRKALYGLKQSPRQWYKKLRQWLLYQGWQVSQYDECVFLKKDPFLIITIYVDDINIFGPDKEAIEQFKLDIAKTFKITDEGVVSWYLGMQINITPEGVHLHQSAYTQQILNRFGLGNVKASHTPLDASTKLTEETHATVDPSFQHNYQSKVGSLNYDQTKTRPDISFAVSLISRYSKNPNQHHMDSVDQVFQYLAGTIDTGLFYRKNGSTELVGWVDSDWGGDNDTGKSTTGWVFKIAGSPVSWSSQRQKTVSSSSTEAEYVAASDASKEAIWLQSFLNEVLAAAVLPTQNGVILNIDNASAIKLTKNPEFHGRTKHINIRHHFIRECVEAGQIIPKWVSGQDNIADILTKPLAKPAFSRLIKEIGLTSADSSKGELGSRDIT
jgi:hypothetical protein